MLSGTLNQVSPCSHNPAVSVRSIQIGRAHVCSSNLKCQVLAITPAGKLTFQRNFDALRHPEPGLSLFPQSGRLRAVNPDGKSVERPGRAGVAVAANDDHLRFGIQRHELMTDAIS